MVRLPEISLASPNFFTTQHQKPVSGKARNIGYSPMVCNEEKVIAFGSVSGDNLVRRPKSVGIRGVGVEITLIPFSFCFKGILRQDVYLQLDRQKRFSALPTTPGSPNPPFSGTGHRQQPSGTSQPPFLLLH